MLLPTTVHVHNPKKVHGDTEGISGQNEMMGPMSDDTVPNHLVSPHHATFWAAIGKKFGTLSQILGKTDAVLL
jgi:hypothetical protein